MRSGLATSGRRFALAAAMAAAFILPGGIAAANETIDLTIDFAKVLKIDRPAETIIIGNPGIADTTIGDDETLVLTGKAAGTTNLIVFDKDGVEILNTTMRVSSDIRQLTTVFYGKSRQTFSCSPVCEQVISVGDNDDRFQNTVTQIQGRQAFSQGQ
jgi:Flp pilus assembly secretin CpaC